MPPDPNYIDKLRSRLVPGQAAALAGGIALARAPGRTAYAAGGPVRDLLLDRESSDLDVVIEGDAIALAEEVARELRVRVKRYPRFGTATIVGEGWHIDLITARSETYARPGALPTVRPSTIAEDLARRDFTINAMALALNGPHEGEVLDPHGGRADLDVGLIRVLHARSFQDDATRILRAARYAARFGFRIEEQTQEWLQRDLPCIETIGGARARRELERIFAEDRPQGALMRLHALGALKATHPGLTMAHAQSEAFARIAPVRRSERPIAFALLAWQGPADQLDALAGRLALTNAQAEAVRAVPMVRDLRREPMQSLRPSQTDAIFSQFPLATVTALGLIDDGEAGTAAREWLGVRGTRPSLRGDDLEALGVPRGPALGEVLARLRAAKLDGEVATRADEEAWVRDYLTRDPK